ncbi:hypothetical protein J6590_097382 [Homalodisca vitripennis]|nr:hypothetical protein J6590_097382 [Homalodisca vitripennis]
MSFIPPHDINKVSPPPRKDNAESLSSVEGDKVEVLNTHIKQLLPLEPRVTKGGLKNEIDIRAQTSTSPFVRPKVKIAL